MTIRMKTVEYFMPVLATAADAADTNFGQITVVLPETSKSFQSVVLEVQAHAADTAAANISRRQLSMSVNGSAYTVVNNTQLLTSSGEQFCFQATAAFTALFNTFVGGGIDPEWDTVDARVLFDSSAASSLGFRNITAKLTITYTYDDVSATEVKTVRVPLDPVKIAVPTTKPGSANCGSIPALNTFLPEASVTIRQATLVVQGNTATTGTADHSLSIAVGALANYTSGLYEAAANSDMWFRLTYNITAMPTDAAQGVFLWGSLAKFNHPQVWAVITYTFDPAATTTVLNSLLLPMEVSSPMGDNVARYVRTKRDVFIQEPGPITVQQSGLHVYWDQLAAMAGLNMRIGTGAFVAYTDTAATLCGGNGATVIAPGGAITLARGRNSLSFDVYNTDTSDVGYNVGVLWMLNYHSAKAPQGVGAHNHTVIRNLATHDTVAAAVQRLIAAVAPDIPETDFFYTAVGVLLQTVSNSTAQPNGLTVQAERLSAEGGFNWETVYTDVGGTDPEIGVRTTVAQARTLFFRWPGDIDGDRMDLEAARRWKITIAASAASFMDLDYLFTYHAITYPVSGTVSGNTGDGSGIPVRLVRAATGERVKEFVTAAGGTWSGTWYDDTEELFTTAVQGSLAGRSLDEMA
jgi:hypothetical protein